MSGFYKRLKSILLCLACLMVSLLCACNGLGDQNGAVYFDKGLSVVYIDVGQGDCIFIHLPDGKNMLIDVGPQNQKVYQSVSKVLNLYSVKTIDYLVLTHPDGDHIGNAKSLIGDYQIGKAFLPNVTNTTLYANFLKVKNTLALNGTQIEYSAPLKTICGTDYEICFLSPIGSQSIESYYNDFNLCLDPSDNQENNLSPIIYMQYNNIRFLFTGDADSSQEKLLLYYYQLGVYNNFLPTVNLEYVDVLKVSHHGSSDGTSEQFLSLVSPKTAIISVAGNNPYGLPSTATINKLLSLYGGCDVLRTDLHGTVTINVSNQSKYSVHHANTKK